MVYRKHAEDVVRDDADADPNRTLLRIDASGRQGQRGRDGHHGGHGSGPGHDGQPGGDAGPAERGHDGGAIQLRLSRADDGSVRLDGELRLSDGRSAGIRQNVDAGDAGYIDVLACGGRGGDGGDGGRGGDGARGRSGSDATRYSSGSDGGPGGDGGHGGNATSGADGGHGGDIVVSVSERDTALLMLIRQNVQGGAGGAPGHNGAGGIGGAGGSGGSSYSWTESESYTDADGQTQTRTTHHRNPGGSSGRSGSNGMAGRAIVAHGNHGEAGRFAIDVDGTRYPSRYELRLTHLRHVCANADGVYEPGERVQVVDLEVTNVGGMPTPSASDIELSLQQLGWVIPDAAQLILPKALPAGHAVRLTEPLWFTIGDYQPQAASDPLEVPETIRQAAWLPDVHRGFDDYETDQSRAWGQFVISFPIRASAIERLPAMAPGEASKIRFSIENTSKSPLGSDSPWRRRVSFRLAAHESELGDAHAALFDDRGARASLASGWMVEIPRIEPGERLSFEATVGFTSDAPHYRNLCMWLALALGRIDQPGEPRPVQYRAVDVRVARRYQHDPRAQLLLVVNHRTTHEELAAWQALLAELGLVADVWDLSLMGGLPLQAPLVDGRSLCQLFEGQTLVLLNNSVSTPLGERSAYRCVDKRDWLAAAAHGIHLAFIGKGVGIERLMLPTLSEPGESHEVRDWALFSGEADVRKLGPVARALSRSLSAEHPEQRYLVTTQLEPEVLERKWWMTRHRVGRVEVRPMLPVTAGRLLSAEVDEERLHDAAFVRSNHNLLTLLLARSFDDKLERLDATLADPAPRDEALPDTPDDYPDEDRSAGWLTRLIGDAMLVDVASEQANVLEESWRAGLSAERMLAALPSLRRLAGYQPSAGRIDPESVEGRALLWMVARLRRFAWSKWRFCEWPLFPFRRAPRLWWITRRLTGQLVDNLFFGKEPDALGRSNLKQARRMLRSYAKHIDRLYRNARSDWTLSSDTPDAEQAFAEQLVLAPLKRRGITSDAEVLDIWPVRIADMEELRAAEARDRKRAAAAARIGEASVDAAATLACAASTEELLNAAPTAPAP